MKVSCERDFRVILRIATGLLGGSIVLAGCRARPRPTPAPTGLPAVAVTTVAVTTYHYDNARTGWNPRETQLTYSNVNSSSLSVSVIKLDDVNDQVDAQPLIVPNLQIAGAIHDVVYVATEANNIYALDANTGARLKMVNLGPPVSVWCQYSGPAVGITGTPVIDLSNGTMYVITYSVDSSSKAVYLIHALDLATLTDRVQPRQIAASHSLSNGNTSSFNAAWQRQRPGLLLANGNVYAGFGDSCNAMGDQSSGWLLGWRIPSLTPLSANELNDSVFSSVWMSGYGIAGDQDGHIYFFTGKSDPGGTTYNESTNISNSVVRLNPDLTRLFPTFKFFFTPARLATLNVQDPDVGAGGTMLLPPQPGPVSNMAVATAIDGRMFLLDRENLGGFTPNDAGALVEVSIGSGCWCGPSYFNDGTPHIVSSGGTVVPSPQAQAPYTQDSLGLWDLQTSPRPRLIESASGNMPDTFQDPGFFTTVSSNGRNSAIIWAVSRPPTSNQSQDIWLYAFKATPSGGMLPQLFKAVAGSWPYAQDNSNIVPVVAEGKVYVASYKELDIFGLNLRGAQGAKTAKPRTIGQIEGARSETVKGLGEHWLSGIVRKVDSNRLTIETRDRKTVEIDATEAKRLSRYSAVITVGGSVVAAGSIDASGVLQAVLVSRVKSSPASWPPDR